MSCLMPPSNFPDPATIGPAECGLVGPFVFPAQWTFQRNPGRKSQRRQAHRRLDVHGIPLFIEAALLPMKRLKSLMNELARRVWEHYALDIGETFFAVFPVEHDEAIVDLMDLKNIDHIPREGSCLLIQRLRLWFYCQWGQLQRQAVETGRYFPPPQLLRARVVRNAGVRLEVGFAPGFVPAERLITLWVGHAPENRLHRKRIWWGLLSAEEPVPQEADFNDFLSACARRFAQPGETVWETGFLYDRSTSPSLYTALREGDALAVRANRETGLTPILSWQGRTLGNACYGTRRLHVLVSQGRTPTLRIIRLGPLYRHEFGRIAFALYGRGDPPRI